MDDLFDTVFQPARCIACGKDARCYTDPETSETICFPCLENWCENVAPSDPSFIRFVENKTTRLQLSVCS